MVGYFIRSLPKRNSVASDTSVSVLNMPYLHVYMYAVSKKPTLTRGWVDVFRARALTRLHSGCVMSCRAVKMGRQPGRHKSGRCGNEGDIESKAAFASRDVGAPICKDSFGSVGSSVARCCFPSPPPPSPLVFSHAIPMQVPKKAALLLQVRIPGMACAMAHAP